LITAVLKPVHLACSLKVPAGAESHRALWHRRVNDIGEGVSL